MKPKMAGISMITLGVGDVSSATRFYEAMGWHKAPQSQEEVSFMQGHNIVLGLFGRHALAGDANVADTPTGFAAISLAVNLPSPEDVDAFFALALANGATAAKQPQKVFWGGYSGYFHDPEGHLWEVAHNPFFSMDEAGQLQLLAEKRK
jgi:uncharacterized protein